MKVSNKPILIVGYGSIGRRHLRNLKKLGYTNFVIYRTGNSTLPTDEIANIPVERTLAKALAHKPFATIIANPTSLHMPVALASALAGSHIFLEKPISHTMEGVRELASLVKKNKLIVQTGFQFRFHPSLLKIKQRLEKKEIGKIISVQAHWGEYLPDWHPWEDYRNSYSVRRDLGGGVLLTLCHPFDYLQFLIGEIKDVSANISQNRGLTMDVEDTADVLLRFKNGPIVNVHLDYLEQPGSHFIRILGQNGIISWNNSDSEGARNKMFISEMKHFLSCIKEGRVPLCTLEDGINTLKIILAAKKSADENRTITIKS